MTTKMDRTVMKKENWKKKSPREDIISKRYGYGKNHDENQMKPRTINELYKLRYRSKIH